MVVRRRAGGLVPTAISRCLRATGTRRPGGSLGPRRVVVRPRNTASRNRPPRCDIGRPQLTYSPASVRERDMNRRRILAAIGLIALLVALAVPALAAKPS